MPRLTSVCVFVVNGLFLTWGGWGLGRGEYEALQEKEIAAFKEDLHAYLHGPRGRVAGGGREGSRNARNELHRNLWFS